MKRIIFMGTPNLAAYILKEMLEKEQTDYEIVAVVSQPDKPVGRKRIMQATPVKQVAEAFGIPVLQPEKIKTAYDELAAFEPDLIVTAAYGQIVPATILELPKYKCINIHGSLLPKYRGGAPIQYAIMQGEKETGITIMYMEKKMDAGDMLYQKAIPITDEDNQATMFEKLQVLGAEMILEMLPDFFAGNIKAIPQDETQVIFSPTIKKEETLIDWTQSAEVIFNHVRGLSPAPATYTTLGELTIKIYAVAKIEKNTSEKPGTIIRADKKNCFIATGNGVIALTDIQISGKKRQPIQEVMNGAGRNLLVEGACFEGK